MFPTNDPSGSASLAGNEEGWYFTRADIDKNSPSRLDSISLREETHLRRSYCTFLTDLGSRLNVYHKTLVRAMLFCHRFFLRQSLAKNHSLTVATVCMYISLKIDTSGLDLKHVIIVSNEIIHKKHILAADERQQVFERYREAVVSGEKLVLSTLNFDLNVDLPYDHLTEAVKKYTVDEAVFAPAASRFIGDCYWTTLCLQYKPCQIAGGAFFLAAISIRMDLRSYASCLLQQFGITAEQLNDISNQMCEFYPEEKPIPASEGSNSGDVDSSVRDPAAEIGSQMKENLQLQSEEK